MRKVTLRIVPFAFLVFLISFLDRANISYAALAMSQDLALTSEAFGFAAGVFFIGYFLFEVPSNFALRRYGSRVWLTRIQISWGLVACASAFVQNAHQLYLARFLLGVTEAGLIPGLIAYFNYWFPLRHLGKVGALLGAAVPVAYMISGPLSTWIMATVSVFGLDSWRGMLLLEGLPALVTGLLTLIVLTERPENASWLTQAERSWLVETTSDANAEEPISNMALTIRTLLDARVLYLGLIYFLYQCGNFGIGLWMPQLLKMGAHNATNIEIGWLAAVPYVFATAGLYFWSARSDRKEERRLHSAVALIVAGVGLAASAFSHNVALSVVALSVSLTGFYAFKAPFNVIPRLILSREAAVISFAVINAVGNAGSFVGPYLFGLLLGRHHNQLFALLALAFLTLLSAALTLVFRIRPRAKP